MSKLAALPALCLLMTIAQITGYASGPVFWESAKQDEMVRGDAQGVSIDENGAITLAPAYTLVYDTKEAYIWSSAIDSTGDIYLGTGHEGRIYKVTPDGKGKLLYDSPELDVTAIATDPAGNVYAGTSPDGKIYKIAPDGTASVFYDPPDKYIWALVFDPASHILYAGTGSKGKIYRIDSRGKAAVLAETPETNIVSLALLVNGDLIAGTEASGLVLKVSAQGKVFALLDSPLDEIHSLAVGPDGSIYALGINQQAAGQARRSASAGVSTTTSLSSGGVITITSSDEQDSDGSQNAASSETASIVSQNSQGSAALDGAKSAVLKILPDGSDQIIWSSHDIVGFGMKLLPGGQVLVGTGTKGRIYSISPNHNAATLLIQSPEDETSTILGVGNDLYATSSNMGRLYRVGRQSVPEGTYVSTVRDARFVSDWGSITWRGSGDIQFQSRSGNTGSPDKTWSDWSAPYTKSGQQMTSPKARFIQWKALLKSAPGGAGVPSPEGGDPSAPGTTLESVIVAYLAQNQPPVIGALTVLPTGVALQEMPMSIDPSVASSGLDPALFGVAITVPPRRYYQKGARSLIWQASDPNDDTLVYRVSYRALGEAEWHLLADNLTSPYYTIDGSRLPDGSYWFKVEASDSPSNPAGTALTTEYKTEVIQIDNTPPVIQAGKPVVHGKVAEIEFEGTDSTSRILKGEFSVDGGPWQLVYPEDGIADSPHETFKVTADLGKTGEHVVAFRCTDSSYNVGTGKVTVVTP